jgi:hypothetical protein
MPCSTSAALLMTELLMLLQVDRQLSSKPLTMSCKK